MPTKRFQFVTKHFKVSTPPLLFLSAVWMMAGYPALTATNSHQDTGRTIVSDDFVRNRPNERRRRKPSRKAGKVTKSSFSGLRYRLASSNGDSARTEFATESQLGLTFWKMRPLDDGTRWIAERVEADTEFKDGDYLRLTIESPRTGYLYVIDRDWFADGSLGETKLIFPIRGEDNRLIAGKLIDIPDRDQAPFRADPKPNQAGEVLTMIVTSSPLSLPISNKPLPISETKLMEWEETWGGSTERFELKGGAGQVRTIEEQRAAARKGSRQLTRDDPPPQTIYVLATKERDAFLFNVKLSYAR